jgi:hypothetical protein
MYKILRNTGNRSSPIGNSIELEGLEKYVLKMENDNKSGQSILVIEDSVNRCNLIFENPRLEKIKRINMRCMLLVRERC